MVHHARLILLAFSLVSQAEVIMHKRIIRVEFQDAFVFGDGFIQTTQFQIGVGQTIFISIDVPSLRLVFQRLFEILDSVCRAPAL